MSSIIRKRIVPSYYNRDINQKLQRLTQGSKLVEEYHKKIEISMIRVRVYEKLEPTMV